jgi:hypothetical protein
MVPMNDHGVRQPRAAQAVIGPARSKFPILLGERKGLVEPTDSQERAARHGDIIRREIPGVSGSAPEPLFRVVTADLMRRRE